MLASADDIMSWFGQVPVLSATLRLTKECEARCPYCYSSSARRMPNELTREEVLRAVDQICDLGAIRLFVSGGEPTQVPHLADVVARAASRSVRVAVSTHGNAVSDALLRDLAAAGLSQFQVSLDACGEQHDRIRGVPGLYERAVGALTRANATFGPAVDVIVATVVTRANLASIPQLFMAVGQAGARSFAVVPLVVTGRAKSLLSIEVAELMTLVGDLARMPAALAGSPRLRVLLPPALVPGIAGWEGYVHTYPFELAIDANGDVALTDLGLNPPKRLIGNVRSHALADIYPSAAFAEAQAAAATRDEMRGVCRSCLHWDVCGGGNRLLAGERTSSDPLCQAAFEAGLFPATALLASPEAVAQL